MTRMSTSLGKKIAFLCLALSLIACAPVKEKEGEETPAAQPPRPQAPPTTLPKLTDAEKKQTLNALEGFVRMNNSLLQVYTPEENPDLDATEQVIVKTLQDYCTVAKDSHKNGNITDESFSLIGDACPAKNTRKNKNSLQSGAGFIFSERASDDDYELLTPQLTQFLPQTAAKGKKYSSTRITMPNPKILQQTLVQKDEFAVQSVYGQIVVKQSVDLTMLNLAIENGDYIDIGELLQVSGAGTKFSFKFASFEALIEVKYRVENGKLAFNYFINGEPLSGGLYSMSNLAVSVSSTKVQKIALNK